MYTNLRQKEKGGVSLQFALFNIGTILLYMVYKLYIC